MNNNELDINLLQQMINSDKIPIDVLKQINEMKKEKILEIHTQKITPPKDSESRWQTYIKDENEVRKKVSSLTENGLYDKLYEFYFDKTRTTLFSLYPEWIEKRRKDNVNVRTIRRNQNHWEKYYANHKIMKIPISKLCFDMLESFFHECIRTYNLTVKELNNMKFIMTDMLKMAKKRKLITENPMFEVEINTNACRPIKKQNDISRVYLPEEKEKIFQALNNEIMNNPDNTDSHAIFLLFKLGLRIGEVAALKWNDIDLNTCEIHIHRMETIGESKTGKLIPIIADYTKKKSPYGDRFLPLSQYEISLFETVKKVNGQNGYHDNDFIFCDAEGRTKIREIDNRIRKLCNKSNIEIKSAHDIRRTVASEMFNNGVPVEIIRNYLGHSDIKTTWTYILDNHKKEETARIIIDSLNSLSGLKPLSGLKRTQTL